jgi:hypothetical protein
MSPTARRRFALLAGSLAAIVACESKSSSEAPGGGSGNVTSTTTCDPQLDPQFFASARTLQAGSTTPPCPPGRAPELGESSGTRPLGPPITFTTEASLVAASCPGMETPDAGDRDAGAPVDWATSDVVAVPFIGSYGGSPIAPPLLDRAGVQWVRRSESSCGGARPSYGTAYYVVPKGARLSVETCSTTCSCEREPCIFP